MVLNVRIASVALLAVALGSCGESSSSPAAPPPASPSPTATPTPTPTPTPPPGSVVVQPQGIFALTSRNQTDSVKAALVALPYVDGMTSFVGWSDIEPVKGQFDFSRLDADIAIARAAGKKISIGVFTGKNTIPAWVAGDGVQTWVTSQGDTLIHPTDPKFTALWTERIALLGQRYDLDPTVVQVDICGAAGTLCGPRYPELPAGTTLEQLVAAWDPVIAAYVQAFPNTYKHIEVHSTVGYGADLPVALFAKVPAIPTIGPFLEFLSDTNPPTTSPNGIAFAQIMSSRSWCAMQTVSPLADKIDDAILFGKSYGCNYFEVYRSDLEDYGALVSAVR